MKKILYIVSTLQKAGPTNQLSYIIKYLDKTKYEPIVLTLSPEFKNSMIDYFQLDLKIRVETLNLSRLKGMLFARKKVENFITDNNIDLIHTQGLRADVLSSKLKVNIPKIATIRNYPQLDFPMTYGRYKGYMMTKVQIKALKKLNICCGVSDAVADNLRDKFSLTNIATVRNGVDMDKYFPLENEEIIILKEKLSIPMDKKIFISIGHLSDRKDPLLVINAFNKSSKSNQLLIFLGDGNLKQKCIDSSIANENILILGKVDNVNEYLSVSDYFISASFAEGLPNTVLESFAINIPAILSDIPPHIELHKLNNNTSKIFKTKDINSLVDVLDNINEDNYQVMKESCQEIINNYLDAKVMSNNYQIIYNDLLEVEK